MPYLSCAVMNTHAIKDFRSRGAETLKFLSNLNQIKLPGLHPSMSMDDLVNHIGHCISEQMGSDAGSNLAGNSQHSRSILEEFTQYLFNDTQLTPASDEQYVMSRVNSLYCLLQKDPPPSTAEDKTTTTTRNGNNVVVDAAAAANEGRKVGESTQLCKSKVLFDLESQQEDGAASCGGGKQGGSSGMSRKESAGDLLLNLPRIASLPQFLFPMNEDSVNQVR